MWCDVCKKDCPAGVRPITDMHGETMNECCACAETRLPCMFCGDAYPQRHAASFPQLEVCRHCVRFNRCVPKHARVWLLRPLKERTEDIYNYQTERIHYSLLAFAAFKELCATRNLKAERHRLAVERYIKRRRERTQPPVCDLISADVQ